jgi:hypothetical protein
METLNQLCVTCAGQEVGRIAVAERLVRKVRGQFIPTGAFEQNRALFDEVQALAQRFDESHDSESLDYQAFDQWVNAVHRLSKQVALPEIPSAIKEFALFQDLQVEITFVRDLG